jgi:hypothetical protein
MQPRRHRDHGPVDVIHDGVPQRGLWYRRRGIAKTGAALSGGGFANITSAKADQKTFADFNGIDITIPGFTFTDIAFDVQLNPTEQSGTDSFTAQAFSGAHISDGTATGSDTPDDDKQFSLTAVGGAFDEVNLLSADGFNEIKHIEISGLARVVGSAVPEPSTWAMLVAGFGLMGLVGYRKTRSGNALA